MIPIIEKSNNSILINGKPIYFYQSDYAYCDPAEIEIISKSSGYDFIIKSPVQTTIVVPCFNKQILVGDSYQKINVDINEQYYCRGPTSILLSSECERIYSGSIHLEDDMYWTFSCYGESKVSYFKKFYEQYASLTGVPNKNIMTFHLDVGYNFMPSIAYHNPPRKEMDIFGVMSKEEIDYAIHYGAKINIVAPDIRNKISEFKEVQSILDKNEIFSVATGSVAEHLNGIECPVKDIDIMVSSYHEMHAASNLLSQHNFTITKVTPKWIRLNKKDTTVDLSYDNYQILPFYVKYNKEIKYLDTDGLICFCLFNLQEQLHTGYTSYPRNQKALFEITAHNYKNKKRCNSTLAREFEEYQNYSRVCLEICQSLSEKNLLFKDTRINKPFRVNAFGDDNVRNFSIINLGSPNDCRLVTDFVPNTAIWLDVSGVEREAKIEPHIGFSVIFIDQIRLPGVLKCK